MKNRVLPFIFILTMSLLFSSCGLSRSNSSTVKSLDMIGTAAHMPLVADLKVSPIPYRTEMTFELNNGEPLFIEKSHENQIIAKALEETDADVLVEPRFKSVQIGNKLTITLKGYPAKYENFRSANLEEAQAIYLLGYQNNKREGYVENADKTQKHKKKAVVGAALGGVAGLSVLGLLAL